MSTFNEFRGDFIKDDIRSRLGDGVIGVFVSQSAETSSAFPGGRVFIAGINVPYVSGSSHFGSTLKDTTTVYLQYTVTSSLDSPTEDYIINEGEYVVESTVGGGEYIDYTKISPRYPYPFASGSTPVFSALYPQAPGAVSASYASGSKGYSVRFLEIPIKEVQARKYGYFFDPEYRVEVPVLLAPFGQLSYLAMKIAFSGPENFYKDNYNAIVGNYTEARKSRKSIVVDRSSISPRVETYANTTLPGNYPVVLKYTQTENVYSSGSSVTGSLGTPDTVTDGFFLSSLRSFENVDPAVFASIQDSNYSSKAWRNLRYDGVTEANLNILGNEPALSFQEFEGTIYPSEAVAATVKDILDADREIVTIYYVNFNKANELRGKNPGGSSTLPTFTYDAINIVTSPSSNRFSVFYEEQAGTRRLIPLDSRKIYSIDRGVVYRTDEDGKVSGVE